MILVPIQPKLEDNQEFIANPLCSETLTMSVDYYQKVGFVPPWICYYARKNDELVGSAGFKGAPRNGKVEIAYGTFDNHRQKGIVTEICRHMVDMALKADPTVRITARTLAEPNYSTRILEKNSFKLLGTVVDPEDGEVWEWEFVGDRS